MTSQIKIISSAPGKTILHGEHAVVFGKNAIAVSVDLRTTVIIELKKGEDDNQIILNSQDFDQTFVWTLDELDQIGYETKDVINYVPIFNEHELYKLDLLLQKFDKCDNPFAFDTAKCFLLILLNASNIFNNSKPIALTATIATQLPIGAGMGSSASFSVSLTAALLKAFDVLNLTKELVSKWSFECEKLFHGKPSGIDNSICTYGGAILFKNGQIIEQLNELKSFDIILVYTNVARNTKELVAKTSSRLAQFPEIMDNILDAIDKISLTQWSQIKNDDYNKIQTLVTINQNLLNSIGAGHEAIDDIVKIANEFDLAAKLTGAGGGGTVFILPKPNIKQNELDQLLNKLKSKNYKSWIVKTGSIGLTLEETRIEKERKNFF